MLLSPFRGCLLTWLLWHSFLGLPFFDSLRFPFHCNSLNIFLLAFLWSLLINVFTDHSQMYNSLPQCPWTLNFYIQLPERYLYVHISLCDWSHSLWTLFLVSYSMLLSGQGKTVHTSTWEALQFILFSHLCFQPTKFYFSPISYFSIHLIYYLYIYCHCPSSSQPLLNNCDRVCHISSLSVPNPYFTELPG